MFLDNYPCVTSEFCHSHTFTGLKSAPALLLLHGFMDSPYDLLWIGKQLNEAGYTVYIPRLPGHGTNADDFLLSTRKDWLRRAFDAYIDISAIHEQVFVAGHSMGALLASLIAARFNPKKLILFAPSFTVSDKRIRFTPFLKFFIKKIQSENYKTYNNPDVLKATADYIGVQYVPMLAELYKLQKLASKNLTYIKAETLIVLSEKDPIIPMSTKNLLDEKLKVVKDYLTLKESLHYVSDGPEREEVAKKVIEFLKL